MPEGTDFGSPSAGGLGLPGRKRRGIRGGAGRYSVVGNGRGFFYGERVQWKLFWMAWWMGSPAALAAVVMTGAAATPSGLEGVTGEFRALVSAGGTNNGVGGTFPDGRREVGWDVASLDPLQVPAAMPGNFFNAFSMRGLELTTPGSLRVSGRAASGSPDVRFSTLNPAVASNLQTFSPERLLAVYGSTTVEATFFMPSAPSQRAYVRGFGAVFADVTVFGPSRLEAFGRSGALLASVEVPAAAGGLSFAGVWMDDGEWIDHVRLTVGQTGIETTGGVLDIVALDDFIYAEPRVVPEPGVAALVVAAALGLAGRRRGAHRARTRKN